MPSVPASSFVPNWLGDRAGNLAWEAAAAGAGLLLLCLLAQVAIPLPWTPVPITGQTFGVTLIALTFGKRSLPIVLAYLGLGAAGLPVFAAGKAGLAWGPTVGYLVGMVVSSLVVGTLADFGFAKRFGQALGIGFLGSLAVFGSGLFVLSYFVPRDALLTAGLWPFVPGDLIKTTLAAALATGAAKTRQPRQTRQAR